ncbi:putative PurR-regulated permease PerM [Catalinimonas alkaloidigena]|uniref:AI-2E family transporter n=1 Tax=Catalinimonas alkaloidigena TaxID=1075417 RepID=UPI0024072499|nr:AI-2E family transporter [Catalinimonas alkaloidigena]MDF9796106.1 putative PurR-regulated permease PerM [Catalinimonas alkaloidigena]
MRLKYILTYFALIVVSLSFFFWGLVQAKAFLVPLSVAALLAMVMLPVCRWFERKKINRGWASFFSVLIIMSFFLILFTLVGSQVESLADDWPEIKQRIEPKIEQLQEYIAKKTGISVREQEQKIAETIPGNADSASPKAKGENQKAAPQDSTQQQAQSRQTSPSSGKGTSGAILQSAGSVAGKFIGFLGTFLLTFIYIFFFLLYRKKFRLSVLKMIPEHKKGVAQKILYKSTEVSQNYLSGRLILIIFLAILYTIGLTISGVPNAMLIALLAAVLSLIPYLGNVIGYVLTVGMALFSAAGITGVIGVSITFTIAQFVESYILEPYVVGDKVNLNPVVTIIVVVLGEAVWGIIGMLIAIPALGVLKVVFDNIPSLRPFGYLFGSEDISQEDDEDKDNFFSKAKHWALKRFK